MTEGQYEELAKAVDEIAERLRAVHKVAPVSLNSILTSADLLEFKDKKEFGAHSLADLAKGHRLISSKATEAIKILQEENDPYGADLLTKRVGAHDKACWMLMSFIER